MSEENPNKKKKIILRPATEIALARAAEARRHERRRKRRLWRRSLRQQRKWTPRNRQRHLSHLGFNNLLVRRFPDFELRSTRIQDRVIRIHVVFPLPLEGRG
ncbi:uncharacterized protein LOC130591018 [Beta vulgaris subsp. vulgaris]|uniref:uncharacterized protein LOC130591018 n=1 Tax=Beta vulgaris subsp. vulgaris TaxID=3555 RepID=UPI0025480D88|nr:uncharacterized protein LOC130591018 [Beta vulgaris subsp. vulgaris]